MGSQTSLQSQPFCASLWNHTIFLKIELQTLLNFGTVVLTCAFERTTKCDLTFRPSYSSIKIVGQSLDSIGPALHLHCIGCKISGSQHYWGWSQWLGNKVNHHITPASEFLGGEKKHLGGALISINVLWVSCSTFFSGVRISLSQWVQQWANLSQELLAKLPFNQRSLSNGHQQRCQHK